MKYADSNVIGDAGEYFFAFSITNILGWPCRLLDIDIGIDAQVEILDEHRRSTGQFLAVQIKSTREQKKLSLSIETKHVNYWKSIDTPVLLALVNIESRSIHIKHVCPQGENFTINPSGTHFKFDFMESSDLLSESIAPRLRMLAYAAEVKAINYLINSVIDQCEEIISDTDTTNGLKVEDHQHYLNFISTLQHIEKELHECKVRVERVRKTLGNCEYDIALDCLFRARSELLSFFKEYEFDQHDHDIISAFENDYLSNYRYLTLDE